MLDHRRLLMSMELNSRCVRACVVSLALVAGLAQGVAFGQESGGGLEGPKVADPAAPGTNRKFSGGGGNARERAQQTPMPVFVRAFRTLEGEKANESVRLSDEQSASIRKLNEEFTSTMRAYRDSHRSEIETLRDMLPPQERRRVDGFLRDEGPRGARPAKPNGKQDNKKDQTQDAMKGDPMQADPMSEGGKPADAEAAKARLKELLEGAPSPADTQAKMWGVLKADQKVVVEKELSRLKDEASKRGGRPGAAGGAEGKGPGGKGAQGKGAQGEIDVSKMPPRMRERLEKMTPEEREAAIQEYRKRREADEKGGKRDAKKPD